MKRHTKHLTDFFQDSSHIYEIDINILPQQDIIIGSFYSGSSAANYR